MAVDAGSIYSEIRIRLDKLSGDIQSVNKKFDQMNANVESQTKKTTASTTKLFSAMNLSATAAIGAITLAFKKAVTVFAETEQALANVRAVSGATEEEFKLLADAAAEAGSTTRFTAGQAADALYFLASAGLSATQSVEALDGVLTLAGATGSDLAFTAETVTATLSQFGLEASKAADVSNVFAAAASNSQATMEKLAASLRQVGPIAGALGINLEEVTGSLQVLYNAGFRGETAGVALRNALSDLANESSTAVKKLNELGVSFNDVNPEVVGLTSAIGALERANLTTAEAIDVFGKEAGPVLVTLLQEGQAGIESYTEAVTGTNEAAKQYAIQNDTLAGSLDSLKSALEGTGNIFIGKLNPYLREVIDLTADLTRYVGGLGKETEDNGNKLLKWANNLLNPIALMKTITVESNKWLLSLSRQNRDLDNAKESIGQYTGSLDDLAEKSGIAQETLDKLFDRATTSLEVYIGTDDVAETVKDITEQFGLSVDQVVQLGLKSENISDELKDQLSSLQNQLNLRYEMSSQSIIEAEIQKKLLADRIEKDRLEQEELERQKNIAEIVKTIQSIRELETKGLITTEESLDRQIEYRESLLEAYKNQSINEGSLSDEIVANIRNQQYWLDQLYTQKNDLSKESAETEIDLSENVRDTRIEDIESALAEERRLKAQAQNENVELQVAETEAQKVEYEKRLNTAISYYDQVSNLATSFFSALSALYQADADAQIAEIDRQLQAELEARGLAEDTTIESLNKKLEEAIAAGDEETANELRQSIEREKITEDFEREKARIKYQADLQTWELQKIMAGIGAAQAAIQTFAQLGFTPWGFAAVAAGGVTAGLQIAAIEKAKPQPPAFQTGGIVMPSSTGTEVLVAENGASEVLFNTGSEGQAFTQQMATNIAAQLGSMMNLRPDIYLDGKKISKHLADTYYSTAAVTIDGRGIRK